MKTVHLKTVDAFLVFDIDCPTSAGGTRLAPDVTEREAQLLARAMTYKFALLAVQIGGAKGAIRSRPEDREEAIRRYCDEIKPWVQERRFLTASDLGTRAEDFSSLDRAGPRTTLMHSSHHGMPLDAYITGLGVAVAAETVLHGLVGRSVALEGFGKVGGGVALEVTRRRGRLVAFSTIYGSVSKPDGFDVGQLLELRERHGDRLVEHVGVEVRRPADLFDVEADVLVPGARPGVIDAARAAALRVKVVAPAGNVPYTREGLEALRRRGIQALADFACNGGATIGYMVRLASAEEAEREVERRVRELTMKSLEHRQGPFEGARAAAEAYLRTWLTPEQMPDGPPLA